MAGQCSESCVLIVVNGAASESSTPDLPCSEISIESFLQDEPRGRSMYVNNDAWTHLCTSAGRKLQYPEGITIHPRVVRLGNIFSNPVQGGYGIIGCATIIHYSIIIAVRCQCHQLLLDIAGWGTPTTPRPLMTLCRCGCCCRRSAAMQCGAQTTLIHLHCN